MVITNTHPGFTIEQVLMRGIADQVAARLAARGASAFSAHELAQICWAYSKLKVRSA